MTTLEKIVENLKTMPESAQTEVLDFVEYLKSKEDRRGDGYKWEGILSGFCHAWYC